MNEEEEDDEKVWSRFGFVLNLVFCNNKQQLSSWPNECFFEPKEEAATAEKYLSIRGDYVLL